TRCPAGTCSCAAAGRTPPWCAAQADPGHLAPVLQPRSLRAPAPRPRGRRAGARPLPGEFVEGRTGLGECGARACSATTVGACPRVAATPGTCQADDKGR